MKKIFLLSFIAATGLSAMAACSDGQSTSDAPAATLAESNVGVDSATDSDDASALDVSQQAKKGSVVKLKDDNVYRPNKKVQRLTILDFNATWCGPCKQFAPVFEKAAEKYGNQVNFVSIDTDLNPETAKAFGISAIPTVIFIFPSGKTKTYVGTQDLVPESKFNALVQGAM